MATHGSFTFSGTGVSDAAGAVPYAVQAAAYASGNLLGPLVRINEAGRQGSGQRGGFLTRLCLMNKTSGGITVSLVLHFLTSAPSAASTFTDKTAISWNAADYRKVSKSVTVLSTDWIAAQGSSPWATAEVVDPANGKGIIPYELGTANSTLFIAIEARGAYTPAATDDVVIRAAGEHD